MTLNGDLIGTVLAERWEIVEHLGAGAMGTVYRARHVQLRIDVAIKVLKRAAGLTASDIARFYRESQLIASLNHDHIVRVQDTGKTANDDLFFVMEYLRGPNLRTLLQREGPLPWARTRTILLQVCDALSAIHGSGMIHRDLKPHNIVLDPRRNQPDFVKLLDFGVAKPLGEDRQHLTQTGFIVGTLQYMSPEYLLGHPADFRIDIYALGTIAFELVTGRLPSTNPAANQAVLQSHGVPAAAQAVIGRAMARDLDQRYEDAETLAAALAATPTEAGGDPEETTTTRFTVSPGNERSAAARFAGSTPLGSSQAYASTEPGPPPLTPTVRRQPSLSLADKLSPPPDPSSPDRTTTPEVISAPAPADDLPPTTLAIRPAQARLKPGLTSVSGEPGTRGPSTASAPTEASSTTAATASAKRAATSPAVAIPPESSPHSTHRFAPPRSSHRTAPSAPSVEPITPSPRLEPPEPAATPATVSWSPEAEPQAPEIPSVVSQSAESSGRDAAIDPAQTAAERAPAPFSRSLMRGTVYATLAVAAGTLVYGLGTRSSEELASPPVSAPESDPPPSSPEIPPVPPEHASDAHPGGTSTTGDDPGPTPSSTEFDEPGEPVDSGSASGPLVPPTSGGGTTAPPAEPPETPKKPPKAPPGWKAYRSLSAAIQGAVIQCGAQHDASRGDSLDIHITLDGGQATLNAIVVGPPQLKYGPVARCAEQAIAKIPGKSFSGEKYMTEKRLPLAE